MREIKFRAWEIDEKRMVPWNEIKYDVTFEEVFDNEFLEVGQYTGLKDSHGNEIYEGDIIEAVFELLDGELETIIDKGVVVFKDYGFQVQTFEDHIEPLHEWAQLSEELKVIGDIYENPELLPEVTQ